MVEILLNLGCQVLTRSLRTYSTRYYKDIALEPKLELCFQGKKMFYLVVGFNSIQFVQLLILIMGSCHLAKGVLNSELM